MKEKLEDIREAVQYVLEENGYEREFASCQADKFVENLKVEDGHREISPNVFNSIFGGWDKFGKRGIS